MLRKHIIAQNFQRCFFTFCYGQANYAKNTNNAARQGKIMNKFFGNRVTGSKKRWYPTKEENDGATKPKPGIFFTAAQFARTSGAGTGKNTSRRVMVLNKLFMKHITDMLATGEIAENIVGRGMQVSRVKVSPDFASINVYWSGKGDVKDDAELEKDLQSCSGRLRHELSQLHLMGEVPRINFVREKAGGNTQEVESLLKQADVPPAEDESDNDDDVEGEQSSVMTESAKQEFYGKPLSVYVTANSELSEPLSCIEAAIPEMRQDVLGLDHRFILARILTKMRKSKQAWEMHNRVVNDDETTAAAAAQLKINNAKLKLQMKTEFPKMEELQRKLNEAQKAAEKFNAYLNKRNEKSTPDRKKHLRADLLLDEDEKHGNEAVMSKQQKRLFQQVDYIDEEPEKLKK